MKRFTDMVGLGNYYLFLAVVALLPFPQLFLRYACVLWLLAWLLEGRWLKKIPFTIYHLPFILFGLWYGWKIVSGLWAADTAAWAGQIERYIAFGVMIPVGIWGVNERYDWKRLGKVLVGGCICAACFYPALLTVLLHHREIIDATHWIAPWDYSSSDWLYFYQTNLSHVKYRLFLCSVETVGIVLAVRFWQTERRWRWPVAAALLTGSILLSGSRQALISLIVIAIIALCWVLSRRMKWYYAAGIVVLALVAGGIVIALHPRIHAMDFHSEERVLIWENALQHPMDYFWGGLGGGQDGVQLHCGHCHNQYLQELRELGVFGLLLFILAWVSVPLCAPKEQQRPAVLFTALYACNMCTYCMFAKFCGVALWAVGLIFILLQTDAAREQ